MCTYCGKWFPENSMTPLYEINKDYVCFYCENCLETVKKEVRSLPFSHLYTWGEKGDTK